MSRFLSHALIYHAVLLGLLLLFKFLIDFRASSEWVTWVIYAARWVVFASFGALLYRGDLLLLNRSRYLKEGLGLPTIDTKLLYWLKALGFLLFTLTWPVVAILFREQMPFLAYAYLVLIGLAISIGYLEYLTASYEKYVYLKGQGKWGLLSKLF
jgi:hypothetical protein